jgi:putative membrane protein
LIIKFLQGAFIGAAFILPGLSAGTVILILGFYRKFIDDLSSLRLKPYLPLLAGALIAAVGGVYIISYLLEHFYLPVMSFLLGMLIASVPVVINYHYRGRLKLQVWPVILSIAGFLFVWFFIGEPTRTFTVFPPGGFFHFFIGGALASATMLLPGVSGSSVLIIMDLYEDALFAITNWQWPKLLFLALGFVVGLFVLARILSGLYRRFQTPLSFLLAGLILGSIRPLLPLTFSLTFFIFALAGAALVFFLTRK